MHQPPAHSTRFLISTTLTLGLLISVAATTLAQTETANPLPAADLANPAAQRNTLPAEDQGTINPAGLPSDQPADLPVDQAATQPTALNVVSLTASPPRLGDDRSLKVSPGDSTQVEIRVINTSETPITFRSSVQDFLIGADGFTPEPVDLAGLDNRWSLASWLTATPSQQTVEPGESAAVAVRIDVPVDALPGGHYAMVTHQPVFGSTNDASTINQNSTGVNQRVGTLLYLLVDGPINEAAFIRNLNVPKFLEFGPVEFSFELENQSDVHIQPQIGVTITNFLGKRVGDFQPETRNIFPFTSRAFESEWERIWGLGRYKLEVVASYGTAGQVVMEHAYFWLLPVKLIIAVLCILLMLIAVGILVRRHWLHRQQDQSQRIAELEAKLKSVADETAQKISKPQSPKS